MVTSKKWFVGTNNCAFFYRSLHLTKTLEIFWTNYYYNFLNFQYIFWQLYSDLQKIIFEPSILVPKLVFLGFHVIIGTDKSTFWGCHSIYVIYLLENLYVSYIWCNSSPKNHCGWIHQNCKLGYAVIGQKIMRTCYTHKRDCNEYHKM